jgi:hypothetical protein
MSNDKKGKKIMGFRDKAKTKMNELMERHKQSAEEKDNVSGRFQGLFNMSKIPDGIGFWRPKEGEHVFDVIPYFAGNNHPKYDKGVLTHVLKLNVHTNIGMNFNQFVCTMRHWNEADPICQYIHSQRGKMSKQAWSQVAPKQRTVYIVWVHDNKEEEDKGPQLWEVAYTFMEEPLEQISKLPLEGGYVPFSHPDQGKSISFRIVKEGSFTGADGKEQTGTKYKGHQFLDRKKPIPDWVLDKVENLCLDEIVNMHPDFDEVYLALHGTKNPASSSFESEKKELNDIPDPEDIPDPDEDEKLPIEDMKRTEKSQGVKKSEPAKEEIKKSAVDRVVEKKDEKKKSESGKCPGGGVFGKDINTMSECGDCAIWDDCSDENDSIRKGKK